LEEVEAQVLFAVVEVELEATLPYLATMFQEVAQFR
jgi:hypothetical protein